MADPTSFEWSTIDDEGLPNNVQMFMAYDGATETIDSLIGAWTAVGGLIDPCIDGKITGGQILVPLMRPTGTAWKATPATGNNSNQLMKLVFDNDFNQYGTTIQLPSYKETQVNTTPPRAPNLAATALAAFIANIIAGEGGLIFPNSRDLHDLNALRKAYLSTGKIKGARAQETTRP